VAVLVGSLHQQSHSVEPNTVSMPCPSSLPSRCRQLLLQPTRLLAVVIAKNTVGSSWRKVLGTRCGETAATERWAADKRQMPHTVTSSPSCLRLLSCLCRPCLSPREWSRVPEQEKSSVRLAVLQLMLSDSSDRVALQLGLLASNICAFDFPSRWGVSRYEVKAQQDRQTHLMYPACCMQGGLSASERCFFSCCWPCGCRAC
jgi:hypothetical protein